MLKHVSMIYPCFRNKELLFRAVLRGLIWPLRNARPFFKHFRRPPRNWLAAFYHGTDGKQSQGPPLVRPAYLPPWGVENCHES